MSILSILGSWLAADVLACAGWFVLGEIGVARAVRRRARAQRAADAVSIAWLLDETRAPSAAFRPGARRVGVRVERGRVDA